MTTATKAPVSMFRKTSKEAFEKDQHQGGFWKAKPGDDNKIRVLCASEEAYQKYGRELPHIKIGNHFGVGPDSVSIICNLKSGFSSRCEICRQVTKLDDPKERKDASSKWRYRMIVIDYNALEKGQQIWEVGYTVKDQLDGLRKRSGDFDDPEDGYDIYVTRTGEGTQSKYVLAAERKNSPLSDQILKILQEKGFLDLEASVTPASDEEIRVALGGDQEEEEYEEEEEEPVVGRGRRNVDEETGEIEEEEELPFMADEPAAAEEARTSFTRGKPVGARPMREAAAAGGNRFRS